jgi:class 3 adenylate cyclase
MTDDREPEPATSDPDVVETLRRLGIAPGAIQRAMERGDPEGAIFDAVLLPGREGRVVSASEIAAAGGLSVTEIVTVIESFGLRAPDPAQSAFTREEADVFIELASLRDVWQPDLTVQVARVYGRLLARIALAEVELFRTHVEPGLRKREGDRLESLRAVQSAVSRLLPLADRLLVAGHRRWLEYELDQAVVREAETGAGVRRLPGAVRVAVLFCDLKDFTAYADREGDEAAVAVLDRLTEVVTRERGEGLRMIKSIGDGYMLCYRQAVEAVAAGARMIAAMRTSPGPGVHASVHQGEAIAREGDYFGGAVNITARLLAAAGRHELVATKPVVGATEGRFAWEPRGALRIRGVSEPVEGYRLLAPATGAEGDRPPATPRG